MTTLTLPRPRRIRPLVILVASAALVAASQIATLVQPGAAIPAAGGARPDRSIVELDLPPPDAPVANAPGSLGQIDHSIAAWTANVAANDKDFLSAANLAHLYEARARLSAEVADYGRAIDAADHSLAIEPRQLEIRALHARLLLAIHEFRRALAEAQALDRSAPDQPPILAIIGDAQLELGGIDEATALYDRIARLAPGPAVTARLARVALEQGDAALARERADAAFSAAGEAGLEGRPLAWYAVFAGDIALVTGSPRDADRWFDKALAAWPETHDAIAGKARIAALDGDVDGAIAGYRAAIAITAEPDLVVALGDLLALRGERAAAEGEYANARKMLEARVDDRLVFGRHLALFEIDHGGDAPRALQLAEADVASRPDAHGRDVYAWALFANRRPQEASRAISEVIMSGAQDATILYHAGAIALALGDEHRAATYLGAAGRLRGGLEPAAAARLDELLAQLD